MIFFSFSILYVVKKVTISIIATVVIIIASNCRLSPFLIFKLYSGVVYLWQ